MTNTTNDEQGTNEMTQAEINFRLTVADTNIILESLGEQPFAKVFALIAKIQRQADGQMLGEGADGTATGGEDLTPPPEGGIDHGG